MNFVQTCHFLHLWRIGAGYGNFLWILHKMTRLEIQRLEDVGCDYDRINKFVFLLNSTCG